ncbi:MAG: DUF1684 domain-containing protein [Bacteroidota bacterium]|nr:DUF1684 domain-containing protein [Bacteroidota bacterium]
MTKYIALVFLVFSACQINPDASNDTYILKVQKDREEQTMFFKTNHESPIPPEDRKSFISLNYFPVNKDLAVNAILVPYSMPTEVSLTESDGRPVDFQKIGELRFKIKKDSFKLTVMQSKDLLDRGYDAHLFIPFYDETSGKESYAGGRYIENLELNDSNKYILDFNYAQNPSCAYSHNWVCPVPPPENRLPIRIEAGEKKYAKD